MLCFVCKSQRRKGTYVFLRDAGGVSALPPALRETLGELVPVMELELTPERKLAREDAAVVLANLERHGYHLQLPPQADPDVPPVGDAA